MKLDPTEAPEGYLARPAPGAGCWGCDISAHDSNHPACHQCEPHQRRDEQRVVFVDRRKVPDADD